MKLIAALNSINPQVWAFVLVVIGCTSVVVFHKNGIDIGIAAGIIGAGVQMFTSSSKAQDHPPPLPPLPVAPAQPQ